MAVKVEKKKEINNEGLRRSETCCPLTLMKTGRQLDVWVDRNVINKIRAQRRRNEDMGRQEQRDEDY